MKWSLRIGRFAGIDVFVHATFFLLIGWLAIADWMQRHDARAAVGGVLFILAVFAAVVLHEFGHALAARRFGIKTRDITLLPIGGVSRLERMPDDPRQELWVAIAGPLVNVAIAAVLLGYRALTHEGSLLSGLSFSPHSFVDRLMLVNVWLFLFNLLPAFPMDGGRVLRALLAARTDHTRATQIAAAVGQAMALVFGLLGVLFYPMLLFIALFVWIGAESESGLSQMKAALGGIPVSRAMLTEFKTLAPGDPLARAVELILAGAQQDFPVVDGERVIGVLTRKDLLEFLPKHGDEATVESAMRRDFQVVEASEMLETALSRLQESRCPAMPVLSRGHVVGMLTLDNVGEFVMIQNALKGRAARGMMRARLLDGP
jgi:Zn-dependent protease/predicted transcriptional regulator